VKTWKVYKISLHKVACFQEINLNIKYAFLQARFESPAILFQIDIFYKGQTKKCIYVILILTQSRYDMYWISISLWYDIQ